MTCKACDHPIGGTLIRIYFKGDWYSPHARYVTGEFLCKGCSETFGPILEQRGAAFFLAAQE